MMMMVLMMMMIIIIHNKLNIMTLLAVLIIL